MSNGWAASAEAWISSQGDAGDFARRHVADAPMLERVRRRRWRRALDVGCGEGRFCRMLAAEGVAVVGADPTEPLIARARELDPEGEYRVEPAERLSFDDGAFDLVIAYLSLIDIAELEAAIAEMVRVLEPGGVLLIANLNGFNTAGDVNDLGWVRLEDGRQAFALDRYLETRVGWIEWRGIRIQNWHRPLSVYMRLMLDQGLALTHFDEPSPHSGDPARVARYMRAPWLVLMEWTKPGP